MELRRRRAHLVAVHYLLLSLALATDSRAAKIVSRRRLLRSRPLDPSFAAGLQRQISHLPVMPPKRDRARGPDGQAMYRKRQRPGNRTETREGYLSQCP